MFTLIDLPYAYDALEPAISARTMEFHHGKHLRGYVDNLNKLIAGTELEELTLEEIFLRSQSLPAPTGNLIFNNAGQVLNHNLYFSQFTPEGEQRVPNAFIDTPFEAQVRKQWGNLFGLDAALQQAGASLFGSGWVFLSAAPDGTLVITQEPGAGNPITRGLKPLLTLDVWEHAYYLDYQNRRADYLGQLAFIVDWKGVEGRYAEVVGK